MCRRAVEAVLAEGFAPLVGCEVQTTAQLAVLVALEATTIDQGREQAIKIPGGVRLPRSPFNRGTHHWKPRAGMGQR